MTLEKMKENTQPSTGGLLSELHRLSQGLWYVSETDAPLEVIQFPVPGGNEPSAADLSAWAGKTAEEKVETVALAHFLRNRVKAPDGASEEEKREALRFQELQRFLEQHLQEVKVYRLGQRKITALVLGKVPGGEWIGLRTTLVET